MKTIKRREFLKSTATALAVTSVCLCGLNSCSAITKIGDTPSINPEAFIQNGNDIIIDLSKETTLSKVGGATKIKNEKFQPGIIIAHTTENEYVVVSLLCPHRGVEVEYNAKKQKFECASLGSSTFSLEGKYEDGPAHESLKKLNARLEGTKLSISGAINDSK